MKYYTITEAAKMFEVTVKTLQRWDRKGILVPLRTVTNRRLYTQEQIDNVLKEKERYVDEKDILYNVTEAYQRLTENEKEMVINNELSLPRVNRENIAAHIIFFNFFRPYKNIIFDNYNFDYDNQFQTVVVSPWNNKMQNILCVVVGDNACNKENGIKYLINYMRNNNCPSGIFVYGYHWVLIEKIKVIKEINFNENVDIADFKQFLCWI